MATTVAKVSDYYNDVIESLKDPAVWRDFLVSASHNYKLPFDEQVLVFAQRPDATAVLEIEKWNRLFGRWVNKGATGIAVFGEPGSRHLRYYFDISDTHPGKSARAVPVWELDEGKAGDIIDTLDGAFGELEHTDDLEEAINESAINLASDNLSAYADELMAYVRGSRLEGLEAQDVRSHLFAATYPSVSLMLHERCGLSKAKDALLNRAFVSAFAYFDTPETVNALGCAVSDIAKTALREIAAYALTIERDERPQIRTVAKDTEPAQTVEPDTDRERTDDGDDTHEGRRLQTADADTARQPDEASRPVGTDEAQAPEGEQAGDLHQPSDIRETDGAPAPDRGTGSAADGDIERTDDEAAESGREPESQRPIDVDTGDEPDTGASTRDRDEGVGLLLELPTEQQQRDLIEEAAGESPAAFFVSDETLNDELRRGSGFVDSKFRIYAQFLKEQGSEANIRFLKNEYGTGGHSLHVNGFRGFCEHSSKGIEFWAYNQPDRKTFNWGFIERRLSELIKLGLYLSESEKEHYEARGSEQETLTEDTFLGRIPDLPLGSTVFIGESSYELLELGDETVRLHDETSPLFPREMPRSEFDRRLIENPLNDHLRKHAEQPETSGESVIDIELNDTDLESLVGVQIEEQGRRYTVEKVVLESGRVTLRDDTFAEGVGFPISRLESLDWLLSRVAARGIEGQAQEQKDKEQPAERAETQPVQAPEDFRITNEELGVGTPKEKLAFNLAAIKTLKAIEAEDRRATPEEQEVLSRYVGWGALQKAFDDSGPWATERKELENLLEADEYAAARASTLNAHYTSPVVISAMYKALAQMGFATGNILEPSCGIGNFLGLLPDAMKESSLYGVELDPITGRIAKQLYQSADIRIQGFEHTGFEDNFFDVAIGNVPFGSYGVVDKRYDKHHFLIHDYFFAKTLDKVRPGGIVAFITSSGTLDKKNPTVRRYLAERAELIGAIRLPNNAFLANAGTEVTADIVFLQKREMPVATESDWVHLGVTDDGIPINSYFATNPEMVLGEMTHDSRMYGNEANTTCKPYPDQNLKTLLDEAIENIQARITAYERDADEVEPDNSVPADPTVRNYSYTLRENRVYYRENSRMYPSELNKTAETRVKGMLGIRESLRRLIELQTIDASDEDIAKEQRTLNHLYDSYTAKHGLLSSRANATAFQLDSAYPLLCSLEHLDQDGGLLRKADLFTKRTIRPHVAVTSADTPAEALAISLAERAKVDVAFMAELTGMKEESITRELEGVIFKVPGSKTDGPEWQSADEYLSGNVREKLTIAQMALASDPTVQPNIEALEKVIPEDLGPSEITVRLGATWIPPEDIKAFMFELLNTASYHRYYMNVHYTRQTSQWTIEGKGRGSQSIESLTTYGTHRANAYRLIEDALNLRDTRVFDYPKDDEGKTHPVLNKKETAIAQSKQETIKATFADWIWKDPDRRERLCRIYNDTFNAYRQRTFDGSHLTFPGMNSEIALKPHQVDAVARVIYGGNTLLAHVVGAGKTWEITAASQELKRLGLANKSLIVVPNHLTEQWAAEYLTLYPSANILVATKRDFEKRNRKRFCARIATGDYDAVIIGHSQFERIPVSTERQALMLQDQIDDLTEGIAEMNLQRRGRNPTVKQLETTRRNLQVRLEKLNDQSRKDDAVTFEELGIDRLFIDESHYYKNLFLYTKMRNVAGIATTEAQKSSDLFMKCRYLDEATGGKGVIFATGTPISNSMTELYTVQRYLQYDTLRTLNLQHFDAWASTFGEQVTAMELMPEGTGYRAKTRFARFYNLPELMTLFKQVADIQTADMLDLPVPKANFHNVSVKPSEFQEELVAELSNRADRVRSNMVDPTVDNMLKITTDGRKLALDQRLIDERLPDFEESKVVAICENVHRIWEAHTDTRATQLVFCDLSTPKGEGHFSVYNDMRSKLVVSGVPEDEIAFIHTADTEAKKTELFAKVRNGQVRVLIGSTPKMGSGTNVQDRLIAIHDCECPWRPADLEQRAGRIIRQGNQNAEVDIYRYVTEGTFDAYSYQLVENKQKFISQIMTSKSPVRSVADCDEVALSYAEIKALAAGDPAIKEKMDLDVDVAKLRLLKANHLSQRYQLEDMVAKHYPQQIKGLTERIEGYEADIRTVASNEPKDKDGFSIIVGDSPHFARKDAGEAILALTKKMTSPEAIHIGNYRGLPLYLSFDVVSREYAVSFRGKLHHPVTIGTDPLGCITRIDNEIERMSEKLNTARERLENSKEQLESAKAEIRKPFSKEDELQQKTKRLAELDSLLNMDEKDSVMLDSPDDDRDEPEATVKIRDHSR